MNIPQQLVNGLVLGSGYACVALGWTVLLGAAKLVNFAHGQMYMLGAFVCWFMMTRLGLSYPLGILVSLLALGLLGVLMQWAMLRLVMVQNLTSMMIVTLGFGYMIQGSGGLAFGGAPQNFPSGLDRMEIRFGDLWFTW
ncbi:MAG: branched-chain amino acid ABC transporter permease, partial [Hyphomicrobiales bacterium]